MRPDGSFDPDPDREESDSDLIDALLHARHDPRAAELRESAIRQVVATIAASEPPRRLRTLRSALRPASAAAALLIATVAMWMVGSDQSRAVASVADVLSALRRSGDRTYRLAVSPPDGDVRHGLDGATLHLRDGLQYLLVRRDGRGLPIYDGFDGERSFRIRDGRVVEQRAGTGAGSVPMPTRMSELPFGDLEDALAKLRADYIIESFALTTTDPYVSERLRLFARRRSRDVKGPETIEILADPHSGLPHRIVFDRGKFQGNTEPRRLTLELEAETALGPDFFTAQEHVR